MKASVAMRCGVSPLSAGSMWSTGCPGWACNRNAEVDHRVLLFRVWNEHRETPWPKLLGFWGLPDLQVINRENHVAKCAGVAAAAASGR